VKLPCIYKQSHYSNVWSAYVIREKITPRVSLSHSVTLISGVWWV